MIVPPLRDTQVTGVVTDVASATTCDIGAAATRKY